ncbi:MAG TPA: cytochrome c maturation protein CcmE [Thermoanaerobaculia bacterium]|nr:cytochrome c maturation protein CcmE [Thermoanaerobaculia bacterium]
MNRKLTYAFGALLLVAFAAFSAQSFNDSLTPYVPYDEARRAGDRTVQVAGGLLAGSSRYDDGAHALHFTLSEPESGETMPVRYEGLKPANFEEAISIVAIGRYDASEDVFHAEKLLVKCPSKYQGVEVQEYG